MAMTIRATDPLDAETAMPLALLMQHLKEPEDDALVIGAARLGALDWIERHVGQSLSRRGWMLTPSVAAASGCAIHLPMGPIDRVTAVSYVMAGAAPQPWPSTSWRQDGGTVRTAAGAAWCSALPGASLTIAYDAGYENLGDEAPALLTAALMLAGHFYRNREETASAVMASMPFGVKMLCEAYRQPVIG